MNIVGAQGQSGKIQIDPFIFLWYDIFGCICIMTKKQFKRIDSRGREEIWEWEETPETIEALEKFYQIVKNNKSDTK